MFLETAPTIAAAVVSGNTGLPWKADGKRFTHLWHRGEIGDSELLTCVDARAGGRHGLVAQRCACAAEVKLQ